MNTAWATVLRVTPDRPGCVRLHCRLDDGSEGPAVAYPTLCGPVAPGERVLLNTTAIDLGLGTGGVHFVIANVSQGGQRSASASTGHIIKLRYTPLQAPVLAAEETASPWHEVLEDADSLGGMPVVCCELLSQAPAVLAGCRYRADGSGDPPPKVAMIVTDEAALPVAFSDLLATLRTRGLLECVISAGHAFGGDLEAVNVYSALLAARWAAGVEMAIVSPGPGTVGTATRWGFGGVAQGEALNAVHVLGGRGIGVIRASSGDARDRHRGISHHTRTVFTRAILGQFSAAWPVEIGAAYQPDWENLCRGTQGRMRPFEMTESAAALDTFMDGPPLFSMGRGRDADPLFFEAAAAAGLLARAMWKGLEREQTDG